MSYNVPVVDASVDNFAKHYENIEADPGKTTPPTQVKWSDDKSTLYVNYDVDTDKSYNWYF